MKTLYIECYMGAAGDMLMAALVELLPHPEAFITRLNSLGIPGIRVERSTSVKCGITGTHISVRIDGDEEESCDIPAGHTHEHEQNHEHNHEQNHEQNHEHHHLHLHHHEAGNAHHHHTGLNEIKDILQALAISDKVRNDALAVYGLIAGAEARAHGKPVTEIHFHEVGMMDAIADIVGVCLLIEELAPQRIVVSPVHVGCGQIKCAHGILPVPAPAAAYILQGVPTYGGQIRGELCTPTGAALLKHFADEFGNRPVMTTAAIGYGMGKKEFPAANCIRVFMGEAADETPDIVELVCNLDDMTGEELGFALKVLMENGALDVYNIPIQMKKNRPGQMLVCLCRPADEDKLARLILLHTTTFGLRSSNWRRYTLDRAIESIQTELGEIHIKTGSGFGVSRSKPEYEDLARIANENNIPIAEVKRVLNKT